MNTTLEERKHKAIEYMEKLKIYKPYIKDYIDNNEIYYFEKYAGYPTWELRQLEEKIKEIEKKHNCTVYAVTHEFTGFGELYDLLIITDYKEEWDDLLFKSNNKYFAFSYVWNKTDNSLSEFGTIGLCSFAGGIIRIA